MKGELSNRKRGTLKSLPSKDSQEEEIQKEEFERVLSSKIQESSLVADQDSQTSAKSSKKKKESVPLKENEREWSSIEES